MRKATPLDREWIEASKPIVEEILAKTAPVRKIVASWIQRGADPQFLGNLLVALREEHGLRQEALQDSGVRRHVQALARHMRKAQAELERIERLAYTSDYVGGEVLSWIWQQLEQVIASLPALGGKPLPRGRLGERHITRAICALAEHLRERTGNPRWGEIAKLVNALGLLEKRFTRKQIEDRCRQYRHREPSASKKKISAPRRRSGKDRVMTK